MLHNHDFSFSAARAVGRRCAPVLYLAKSTALFSLREAELSARAASSGQGSFDNPLLTEAEVRTHLQYLRSDAMVAPSPYICVAEICSLAAALSGEEEELPVINWRGCDPQHRSLYYNGTLVSLDDHHIPGVHAALAAYHRQVRSLVGEELFDHLHKLQLGAAEPHQQPFFYDNVRNTKPLFNFSHDGRASGSIKAWSEQVFDGLISQCRLHGIEVRTQLLET